MEFITHTPEETEAAGRWLGEAAARSGEPLFIAMSGDLGAGKTVFVRGLASVLSPGSRVKSPTYTLVNEYRRGSVPLFHFDLYRIEDPDELDGFGFEEYRDSGHCVVEWSEKLGDAMPENAMRVTIEKLGLKERRVTISPVPGEREVA